MSRRFNATHAEIAKIGKELARWAQFKRHNREIFGDMTQLWAIALRNGFMPRDADWHEREEEYNRLQEKFDEEGMTLIAQALATLAMVSQNQHGDHLGELYHQMDANSKGMGQFFTPYSVSSMMAAMTMTSDVIGSAIDRHGFIGAHEPSCGAGGMVVAMGEAVANAGYDPLKILRVHAVDIDRIAVNMTFIQSTLQGVPCFVEQANALNPHSGNGFGYRFPNVHYARQVIEAQTEKEKTA